MVSYFDSVFTTAGKSAGVWLDLLSRHHAHEARSGKTLTGWNS